MTERPPWETEPDRLDDFEADGLMCAMRRNSWRVWCGYVGVGPEHPLFGLPYNHPLKLPASWFEGRTMDQGTGPMDLCIHILSGAKSIEDGCQISLAFHVHGGVNFTEDRVPSRDPDGRWWFGFDCGHAGDYLPGKTNMKAAMEAMVESMPAHVRATMRDIVFRTEGVYRDQQYVVSECQSLAAQLNAYAKLIETEKVDGCAHDRRG